MKNANFFDDPNLDQFLGLCFVVFEEMISIFCSFGLIHAAVKCDKLNYDWHLLSTTPNFTPKSKLSGKV
jgi:hypothetical protein